MGFRAEIEQKLTSTSPLKIKLSINSREFEAKIIYLNFFFNIFQ